MKKVRGIGLLILAVTTVVLSGCGGGSEIAFSDVEAAKEALNTASVVSFSGDFEAVNQRTGVLADGQVAGYMEESGFLDPRWTITIDGTTWFYVKIVTDEPINENEGNVVKATTYGFYDANDTCLGYAQQQAVKGQGYYNIYFLDADGNPKDYYADEDGKYIYDSEGNIIATGTAEYDGFFSSRYCHIQIEMEKDCNTQVNFMDRMAMYFRLYRDLNDDYSNKL